MNNKEYIYNKLRPEDWPCLILEDPTAVGECPCLNRFTASDWLVLVTNHRGLFKHSCFHKSPDASWVNMRDYWVPLVLKYPELINGCKCIQQFNWGDWTKILCKHPELVNKCEILEVLSGEQWATILLAQPSLAKHMPENIVIVPDDWVRIMQKHPEVYVAYGKQIPFSLENWLDILRFWPGLASDCLLLEEIEAKDWVTLVKAHPKLVEQIPRETMQYMSPGQIREIAIAIR